MIIIKIWIIKCLPLLEKRYPIVVDLFKMQPLVSIIKQQISQKWTPFGVYMGVR